MSITFPLVEKVVGLGRLWVPYVTAELKGRGAWIRVMFLLDTGADCTLLPRYVATELGIPLATCPASRLGGIEGGSLPCRKAVLDARIGTEALRMTCLISERDDVPLLLGRLDVFDRFSLEIDNRMRVLRLHPFEGTA